MRVALTALRRLSPARIVVAVPVAPRATLFALEGLAEESVCLATPEPFLAVGMFYEDFRQITDQEVGDALGHREFSREAL
jgi:predicted phosphoribosyltransferase